MKRIAFSLLIVCLFVLSACGPAAPDESALLQEDTVPAEAAPEETAPEAAAPAEEAPAPQSGANIREVAREKTVIFENIDGRVPIPDNMNPYISGQYLDWGMWQATQEALFYYNYETGEIMPWLATGYSFNETSDEVTITLREGVKWSDGVDFTADDVVFTIEMLIANEELQYSADMAFWVTEISAPDSHTVVMKLSGPNPRFVLTFFAVRIWDTILIAPKHVWEDKDPLSFTNYDLAKGWPLGTGPYRLVRSTETETVFDRRDDWWAAETGFHALPAPERAIWVTAPTEDTRAAMASNNQLDAMWIFSRSSYEVAQGRNPNIVGWTTDLPYAYLDPCPRFLGLNNNLAPFDDADIRWAVNYAINRDELVTIAYEGMTDPAATLFPTYPPLQEFLDRNSAVFEQYPVLETDLAKVDEIMTGKGYAKNANGFWQDVNGQELTFSIITRAGEADKVKMGPVMIEQLIRAGFKADFQPLEAAIFWDDVEQHRAQAYITDICGSVSDPYNTFASFHSRWAETTDYVLHNEEFDGLVDDMSVLAADAPEFDGKADRALEIWVENLPVIPLVQAYLLTPFNETYWTNWPTAENNYIQPGHWWVTGELILLEIQPAGQ